MRRAIGATFALCLVVSACSGAGEHRATGAGSPSDSTTSPPTTTTVPDITEVPRPANVADDGFRWFVHPAANPTRVLLGVRRSAQPGRHPAILVIDASGGLNPDYLGFADELVAHGFDVAVGCLFMSSEGVDLESAVIPCAGAPPIKGVVDAAVPDLDSVVKAAYSVLGVSTPLAVLGFSRGAGIAALRASEGRPEPVVLVSGKYEGWSTIATTVPGGEVNVVERVDGWRASAIILHGTSDGAVPVVQAYDLEAALRGIGADVESHYYEGAGHNLAGEPGLNTDLENRIARFLCARLTCSGA